MAQVDAEIIDLLGVEGLAGLEGDVGSNLVFIESRSAEANGSEGEGGTVFNLYLDDYTAIRFGGFGLDFREAHRRIAFGGVERLDSAVQDLLEAHVGNRHAYGDGINGAENGARIDGFVSSDDDLRDGWRRRLRREDHGQLFGIVVGD